MRRLALLLWVLATTPAWADLQELLRLQRLGDSGAYVSSGFHDWRTTSVYRRRAGLHAGYDIAMLAGSAVRTPWAGRVVAVTPWYGREVGVTLELANGWEVTFGHITSAVVVGQQVRGGELLGRVVVDHVDVKARGRSGSYVDFAVHTIPTSGFHAEAAPFDSPADLAPSAQEKKAAKRAFAEYSEALELLANSEAKVRSGLLPRNSLQAPFDRLKALRPLALRHVEWSGQKLPQRSKTDIETEGPSRPTTDLLLNNNGSVGTQAAVGP